MAIPRWFLGIMPDEVTHKLPIEVIRFVQDIAVPVSKLLLNGPVEAFQVAVEPEMSQVTRAIRTLGGNFREVKKIELEEFTDQRYLVIIDKVAPTPARYPRRPGIPAKRPLL